ncbi:MAG: hypothetical protein AUJ57_08450 [Zetaproteobacteria bacterium CG1_02_53_45]|nr:MAG: hypothetical protein AUJ57_08450 [Zetaproteobacteria bacterium CG1_02_53_45]
MMTGLAKQIIERPWLWLIGLAAVQLLFMLGGHTFWDIDEPINASCGREMLEASNWLVPMFNGELRSGKPILTYWLMLSSYSLFGVSEFSARLPSAICITLLTLVVTYFGRRLIGVKYGLLAGLMFITSLHMVVIGRAASPDAVFLLTLCTGLLAGMTYCVEAFRPKKMLWLAYACFGLAMLAKGPVSLAMPGMVLFAWLLLTGNFSRWREFHPWRGVMLALALALPWYIAVWIQTDGEWVQRFLLKDNVGRFLAPMEGHRGFPGFYLLTLLLGVFPWTGVLIGALMHGPWRPARLKEQPLRAFLISWIAVFFIFFTIARTQLPNYMLPVFPALMLFMAMWLRDTARQSVERYLLWAAGVLSFILLIGGGIALQRQWPGDWPYALSFLPLLIATVVAWQRRQLMFQSLTAGMMVMVLMLAGWVLPGFDSHKASRTLAESATAAGFAKGKLAGYRFFQESLLYYHGNNTLPVLYDPPELISWLENDGVAVIPQRDMDQLSAEVTARLDELNRVHGLYARQDLILVRLRPEQSSTPASTPGEVTK